MKLELLDGKILEREAGLTGLEIANSIALSLGKKALAFKFNGELFDLADKVESDGKFELITKESKEAIEILNHSTAHLLAAAVKNLYPDSNLGYGPAIEEGFYYDIAFKEPLVEADLPKIEKEMKRLSSLNEPISRKIISLDEGREIFKNEKYKLIHLEELQGPISIYAQGNFADLCKGPHLPNTNQMKHFKLLSLAGAYFKGDSKNDQLTRIYGTSFFSEEELQAHLVNLEERKKRDHRKLGKDLNLFMISDYGPGFPFWLPKGMTLRNTLENFWYDVHTKADYQFIKTPIMLSKELWEVSGHWANYRENMYTSTIDDKEFAIKPMNCPGGMLVYANAIHSYKELPLRLGELGLVHRHEASGALNGLFRVRTFTQDDAHIFLRADQLEDEIINLLKLYDYMYKIFGLSYYIVLSTRPEDKYIGTIETWDKAEEALKHALVAAHQDYQLNPGDGAFYGPKLDFKLRDSMNRIWQCGTIQLDMNLPERFDLTYVAADGSKVRPIMLHRALYGSIERFIGILIEHFSGAFPTWLAPVQVKILPVSDAHLEAAKKLKEILVDNNLRVEVDDRAEKVGYKIRDSQIQKIPYTLVLGDKEAADASITYRVYGKEAQVNCSLDEFLKLISTEIKNKELRK